MWVATAVNPFSKWLNWGPGEQNDLPKSLWIRRRALKQNWLPYFSAQTFVGFFFLLTSINFLNSLAIGRQLLLITHLKNLFTGSVGSRRWCTFNPPWLSTYYFWFARTSATGSLGSQKHLWSKSCHFKMHVYWVLGTTGTQSGKCIVFTERHSLKKCCRICLWQKGWY